jgi:hypothetical protein
VLAKPPAPVTVKFLACFAKNSAFVKIGASAASIKAMQWKASRGDTGFIDLRPLPQHPGHARGFAMQPWQRPKGAC